MSELQTKKRISTSWVFLALLATSPICLIFLYLGMPGSARAGWILAGVIVIAAKVRWDLHDRAWFWPMIIGLSLIHLYAVIAIPWTAKWVPAALIFPACAVDCLIILGILQLMSKLSPSRK